jgi:translation initiation factor IF-2
MPETKTPKRLQRVAKDLNVATTTIQEYLQKQGIDVGTNPNVKLSEETYELLLDKFQVDKQAKEKAEQVELPGSEKRSQKKEEEAASAEASNASQKAKEPVQPETSSAASAGTEEADTTQAEASATATEKQAPQETSENDQVSADDPASVKAEESTPSTEESSDTSSGPKVLGKIDVDQLDSSKKKKAGKKSADKDTKQKAPAASTEQTKQSEEEPATTAQSGQQAGEQEEEVAQEVVTEETTTSEADTTATPDTEAPQEAATAAEQQSGTADTTEAETPSAEQSDNSAEEASQEQQGEEASETVSKKEDYSLSGPTVVGKIDLDQVKSNKPKKKAPVASTSDMSTTRKKRRKRRPVKGEEGEKTADSAKQGDKAAKKDTDKGTPEKQKAQPKKKGKKKQDKEEIDSTQVQEQLKETLNKLSGGNKSSRSKFRKKKRDEERQREEARQEEIAESEKNKLEVTEFITVNELANLMDVQVTELIGTCMNIGVMVSMNQRIDAETITILADEYGYDVEFTEAEMDEPALEEEDNPENYTQKPPVVSIMGHVDHGKTSLLDYIQGSKIIAGESGSITQHIGAYEITLQDNRNITFLDTPGHEAFTAMRARGAKATDVAIIIIAADDDIKPQTKEAISHAQAASVPMIFAINKVDKEGASPDRIRQQLAEMNILVEEWGGKYQSQEISAKHGDQVDDLLEKVLLEAELLDLKADPEKRAAGTVVEAWLDKGKGYVTNLLVEGGTLQVGDPVLAGANMARIRAMMDERGNRIQKAKPGTPVQVLGFDGAPQAGERFYVAEEEQTAKEIANERAQLIREQGIRATKHVTLDELGRRLAIGNFQELNVVIKGDVDGSIEAIADSLQKLSTEEVQINVIHKGVGQISESDVLLASASDAIIVGFQVRPSSNARRLAEQEQIDLRLYSVIYDAVQEVKSAMEGMLKPRVEEKIVGNVEVRQVFKVSKVGTVAGSKVTSGKITRNAKVRVIREGVVVHTGEIDTLKRYKDDVKEVASGYECGLNIKNFNDIQEGDYLEVYEEYEVKRSLN